MKSTLPKNAFEYFNLPVKASNSEIMSAVMSKMKSSPEKMTELAEYQKLLLNPDSRFLIEFIYCLDPKTDFEGLL
jgi:hypothetical protein